MSSDFISAKAFLFVFYPLLKLQGNFQRDLAYKLNIIHKIFPVRLLFSSFFAQIEKNPLKVLRLCAITNFPTNPVFLDKQMIYQI